MRHALAEGVHPEVRACISPPFRAYIRDNVTVEFKGIDETSGHMFTFIDEASGRDDALTPGGLISIHGVGLKIDHDDLPGHASEAGLWLVSSDVRIPFKTLAVNEPRTLVGIIPDPPVSAAGAEYFLEVVTQSRVKRGGKLFKNLRTVRSEYSFIMLPA
jgi:hypothetical protein